MYRFGSNLQADYVRYLLPKPLCACKRNRGHAGADLIDDEARPSSRDDGTSGSNPNGEIARVYEECSGSHSKPCIVLSSYGIARCAFYEGLRDSPTDFELNPACAATGHRPTNRQALESILAVQVSDRLFMAVAASRRQVRVARHKSRARMGSLFHL
jgi:hypothetical protein